MSDKVENFKNKVLGEYEKGNIVVDGMDGVHGTNLKEFIKQPVEGILYDLNRHEMVVLTFIEDPKWVNDYAVTKVIRALKARIKELEEEERYDKGDMRYVFESFDAHDSFDSQLKQYDSPI